MPSGTSRVRIALLLGLATGLGGCVAAPLMGMMGPGSTVATAGCPVHASAAAMPGCQPNPVAAMMGGWNTPAMAPTRPPR
jgi:hypothetical protein